MIFQEFSYFHTYLHTFSMYLVCMIRGYRIQHTKSKVSTYVCIQPLGLNATMFLSSFRAKWNFLNSKNYGLPTSPVESSRLRTSNYMGSKRGIPYIYGPWCWWYQVCNGLLKLCCLNVCVAHYFASPPFSSLSRYIYLAFEHQPQTHWITYCSSKKQWAILL